MNIPKIKQQIETLKCAKEICDYLGRGDLANSLESVEEGLRDLLRQEKAKGNVNQESLPM